MWRRCIIFMMLICIVFVSSEKEKGFGSFNLSLTSFNTCKGPKHKDCTSMQTEIKGYNIIKYDLRVLEDTTPTKGKIIAHKKGSEVLRLNMKKPCDHIFFKSMLHAYMNVTNDCVVMKGRYQIATDVEKIVQSYWGGSFLFGNWTFKSVFYNDECNFYCSIIDVIMFSNKNK